MGKINNEKLRKKKMERYITVTAYLRYFFYMSFVVSIIAAFWAKKTMEELWVGIFIASMITFWVLFLLVLPRRIEYIERNS